MEPLPRTAILVAVTSCNRFIEFPLGPKSLPTKLNWKKKKKLREQKHTQQMHFPCKKLWLKVLIGARKGFKQIEVLLHFLFLKAANQMSRAKFIAFQAFFLRFRVPKILLSGAPWLERELWLRVWRAFRGTRPRTWNLCQEVFRQIEFDWSLKWEMDKISTWS